MTHPVIFLSSKTKTVMCLTEPMPKSEDFEMGGYDRNGGDEVTWMDHHGQEAYQAALKSVMETAVPVDLATCEVWAVDKIVDTWMVHKGESNKREEMIPDKLYPLSGYGVEFERKPCDCEKVKAPSHGVNCKGPTKVALITKLSDSSNGNCPKCGEPLANHMHSLYGTLCPFGAKLSDSKQESQLELWREFLNRIDALAGKPAHLKYYLENNWILTRKSTDK